MSAGEAERVELTVGPVAHGGHCVARLDGQVVFVRHALPGERVIAEVTEVRRDFLRADAVTVLDPAPERVVPPCPYAGPGRCGGCDLQHVAPAAQREWKATVVREQLSRLGGLGPAEIGELAVRVDPVPGGTLGWRSRVRYAVDAAGRAGLLRHRSHEVVPIDRCLIAHPAIQHLPVLPASGRRWPDADAVEVVASTGGDVTVRGVRAARPAGAPASGAALVDDPTAGGTPGGGFAIAGSTGGGPAPAGPSGTATGGGPASPSGTTTGGGPAGPSGTATGGGPAGPSGTATGGWTGDGGGPGGAGMVRERAIGREWRLPPEAFWQVHPAAADTLATAVLELLDPAGGESAWDLYGGAGLFAAALAARVGPAGRVTMVEAAASAVTAARQNLRDLAQVEVVSAKVATALARRRIVGPVDLVVLDPPRAGAGAEVVRAVAAAATRAVAYVACDPAAFARDARTFREAGWRLAALRGYDLFPMTQHVELVALLLPGAEPPVGVARMIRGRRRRPDPPVGVARMIRGRRRRPDPAASVARMRIVGLMSGTSHDGIEVAAGSWRQRGDTLHLRPIGARSLPYDDELRAAIAAVLPPSRTTMEAVCRLDTLLGQAFAGAAEVGIEVAGGADLVVSPGQTVFHWVDGGRARGTLQLGSPAWIAGRTGVPVLSDLRTADIVAGGQGAPLVPAFDALLLDSADGRARAALNLGGIANLTVIAGGAPVIGYDIGPANALIDAAAQRYHGEPYDVDGRHAAAGRVDDHLLELLLAEPFYAVPPPRSTGKELFHAGYLQARLAERGGSLAPDDILATLTELTVRIVADACDRHAVAEVVGAGGGVRNPVLWNRLAEAGAGRWRLGTTDELGIPAQAKEAYAFGLLGWLSWHGLPGALPSVTGARAAAVLGSLTPARPFGGDGPARPSGGDGPARPSGGDGPARPPRRLRIDR